MENCKTLSSKHISNKALFYVTLYDEIFGEGCRVRIFDDKTFAYGVGRRSSYPHGSGVQIGCSELFGKAEKGKEGRID